MTLRELAGGPGDRLAGHGAEGEVPTQHEHVDARFLGGRDRRLERRHVAVHVVQRRHTTN
jgi:hypothetical protein